MVGFSETPIVHHLRYSSYSVWENSITDRGEWISFSDERCIIIRRKYFELKKSSENSLDSILAFLPKSGQSYLFEIAVSLDQICSNLFLKYMFSYALSERSDISICIYDFVNTKTKIHFLSSVLKILLIYSFNAQSAESLSF